MFIKFVLVLYKYFLDSKVSEILKINFHRSRFSESQSYFSTKLSKKH